MTLNDKELTQKIKNKIAVEIKGNNYYVIANKSGSCDNCYFSNKCSCPQQAITICCSNGGNILKLKK